MKRIDLNPNFLQSEVLENPIISVKYIASIEYNNRDNIRVISPERTIVFYLKKREFYWNFSTKELAKEAFLRIKAQLKDVKMIV